MTIKKHWLILVSMLLVSFCFGNNAVADIAKDFPNRPITTIVPRGAGGGSDITARAMQPIVREVTGLPNPVINKRGGGGLAAVPDFMAAPPDGYTVFFTVDPVAAQYAAGELAYHPAEEWRILGLHQVMYIMLFTSTRNHETRFPDWQAVIDYARENPISVAITGGDLGSPAMNMRLVAEAWGFKELNIINYDNPAERYTAAMSGEVDLLQELPGEVSGYLESGRLAPLMTWKKERVDDFPDVPAASEFNLPENIEPMLRWRALAVHPNTPDPIYEKLVEIFKEVWTHPKWIEFNKGFMMEQDFYRSPEEAKKIIYRDIDTFYRMFIDMGMRVRQPAPVIPEQYR